MRTTRVNGLDIEDFESRQVWYESKDSTNVPMFIVRHKSTKLDGTAPVFQYGNDVLLNHEFLLSASLQTFFSSQATAGLGFQPTHTSVLLSWRFCKRMGPFYLSSILEVGVSLAATGTELEPGRIRQVHNSFVAAMK